MTRIRLEDIVNGHVPVPSGKVNVRITTRTSLEEPLIRTVTSVVRRVKYGKQWIFWHWKPEPRADGHMDCGYSGVAQDHEDYSDLAFEM